MHKILLIEPTINPVGVEYLKEHCDLYIAPNGQEETLIEWINKYQIEGMIPRVEPITRKLFESCPSLKAVGEPGVGLDNIDVQAATEHGVKVLNVPDGNYKSVCEHALLFILCCAQNLIAADANVRRGNWRYRDTNLPYEICGKTLLLVGFGRIGKEVAKKAQAFEMDVLAYDIYVSAEQMQELGVTKVENLSEGLQQADYITVHSPLTPETRGMFSAEQFRQMKPTAYFINVSRGPLVNEKDLYEALVGGEIAGAALDVFDPEPPTADNPLFTLENVIVTPHTAGDTQEARKRLALKAAQAMLATLDGEPPVLNWANRRALENR